MTTDREFDRMLDEWFADGTVEPPETLIGAIATRIRGQAQRPAWRVAWGPAASSGSTRSLALIAAAVLVGGIGVALVAGSRPVVDLTATPGPSMSIAPTPSAAPTAVRSECQGVCPTPLYTGTHGTFGFNPHTWFTVPDGWVSSRDDADVLTLRREAVGGQPTLVLELLGGVVPVNRHRFKPGVVVDLPTGCATVPTGDEAPSVEAWAELLATDPDLEASSAESITLDGHRGRRVTLTLRPDRAPVCAGIPDADGPVGNGLIVTRDKLTTVWIVDVAGRILVVTMETGPSMADHEKALATVEPIVASLRFDRFPAPGAEAGPVGAGPYRTTTFRNPFAFDIATSETWWVSESPTALALAHGDADGEENIEFITNVYPVSRDADGCMDRWPKASEPHSASDLIESLRVVKGLSVRTEAVAIGDLRGWSVDVATTPGPRACDGTAYVVLWEDRAPLVVSGPGTFEVLDGRDGRTMVLERRGTSPEFLADADRLLDSLALQP